MPHMPATGKVSLETLAAVHEGALISKRDDAAWNRMHVSADKVAEIARGEKAHYGINTGFGKVASARIPADDVEVLQRNLIMPHCCGVGAPLDDRPARQEADSSAAEVWFARAIDIRSDA
ncbi:MAG: aromatic amino acid lyase [Chelatococcus sp.]|nr:aromatic amino acid lyase [Chelatococcus sp. YT9]MBX3557652.1 aromatic amino acid lyase [Chelatococcus sp.]